MIVSTDRANELSAAFIAAIPDMLGDDHAKSVDAALRLHDMLEGRADYTSIAASFATLTGHFIRKLLDVSDDEFVGIETLDGRAPVEGAVGIAVTRAAVAAANKDLDTVFAVYWAHCTSPKAVSEFHAEQINLCRALAQSVKP